MTANGEPQAPGGAEGAGGSRRWIAVAPVLAIPEGEVRAFEIGAEWIAFCNVGGRIHAVEDLCPHDLGPLGDGAIDGFEIVCTRHGARFDVRDGAVTRPPASCGIRTFPVEVREGVIHVALPGRAP